MNLGYWLKQTSDQPVFPDLLWSRPENRAQAGKLAIFGGNSQSFAAPAEAYGYAEKAGAGTVRVLLPDSLERSVGRLFPEAVFAASTPSGSFSRKALIEWLALADWSDGLLLAGDFASNSETAILLEQFCRKYSGQLTVTRDAANYFIETPGMIEGRQASLLVISYAQLQRLAAAFRFPKAFTFNLDLVRQVELLRDFTSVHPLHIIVRHNEIVFVGSAGRVSTTTGFSLKPIWRLPAAAAAAVWWLQNPTKPFEALTTSLLRDKL